MLVYGATGYTGRLIVERARSRGLTPLLAARDRSTLEPLADALGLEWYAVALDDAAALRKLAARASVVLNAAGPFAQTAAPLIDACIAAGAHYLDITGEVGVAEAAAGRHDAALERGVMVMPAVGFDVVPSDCLAAHVARRLPDATTLRIGVDMPMGFSSGSLKTALAQVDDGVWVRRDGRLARTAPGSLTHYFDFGRGLQVSVAASLCDVSTAFHSTGIPTVEAYLCASLPMLTSLTAMWTWGQLMSATPGQSAGAPATAWPALGPSAATRGAGWATLVAEAINVSGRCARSRLHTGEVYSCTAQSAVLVAERTLAGDWQPGFQTPSRVFGPDFALCIDGVSREDT